jgi:hypothetical protein
MINGITTDKYKLIDNQGISNLIGFKTITSDITKGSPVQKNLTAEDSKNFAEYIDKLGLTNETNILILSSLHHYYYDAEEMINIKAVLNLKELNQIKALKVFLHSIFHILPPGCKFIGCFVNNRKQNGFSLGRNQGQTDSEAVENGISSNYPILNMIYNMMDFRTNNYMSERSVSHVLGEHGFKIIDLVEINGMTYFCAENLRTADN